MEHRSRLPYTVPAILYLISLITIAFSLVLAVQIVLGTLPADSARLEVVPVRHFLHAVSGALFGIIGPIQFGRVLARKYGRLHRVMGRVFVAAGGVLAISSFSLLWRFPDSGTWLVSGGRLVFGIALGFALVRAMLAIRARNIARHRDWMIRAYAIGIGATAVSLVFIPIYAITGTPPSGLVSDIAFIGSWTVCIIFAEWLVRRINKRNIT